MTTDAAIKALRPFRASMVPAGAGNKTWLDNFIALHENLQSF
jgi:hypothetical protein